MNRIYFSITAILLSLSVCSQTSTSKWLNAPLIIDGDNKDWEENPSCYSSACKMLYELKNDSNSLFLVFEITDKQSQQKFMHAGFEVAIKAKTKPKLKATINFLPQPKQEVSMQNFEGGNKMENMHQAYLLNSNYADISGFINATEVISRNVTGDQEFTYNIGWNDKKNMLVEIRIPLSEIFTKTNSKIDYTKVPITLICKLNALNRPSNGNKPTGASPGGRSGGGRSGGGGMSGGGSKPNGQGGSPGDRQTMSSIQSFKAKYYLSKEN